MTSMIAKLLVLGGILYGTSLVAEDILAGVTDSMRVRRAHLEMQTFHRKFAEYYTFNGRYPTPIELPNYLSQQYETPFEEVILDPWRSQYLLLGPQVEIRCCGPDKEVMTRDDLAIEYPPNRTKPRTRMMRAS